MTRRDRAVSTPLTVEQQERRRLASQLGHVMTSITEAQREIASNLTELSGHPIASAAPAVMYIKKLDYGLNARLYHFLESVGDKSTDYAQAQLKRLERFDDRYITLQDITLRCRSIQLAIDYIPLLFQHFEKLIEKNTALECEHFFESIKNDYQSIRLNRICIDDMYEKIFLFESSMNRAVKNIVTYISDFYSRSIQMWYRDNFSKGNEALVTKHYGLLLRLHDDIGTHPEALPRLKSILRSLENNLQFSTADLKKVHAASFLRGRDKQPIVNLYRVLPPISSSRGGSCPSSPSPSPRPQL